MKRLIASDIGVNYKEKRDAYEDIADFINSDVCYDGTVCVLYGLSNTGKTTLMKQVMADTAGKFSSIFLETTQNDVMNDLYSCLDNAVDNGVRCVFIDEITDIPDFIEESALLADIYAKKGLRIILSGKDSLSFAFAENHSLFDRTVNICTNYIPFEEHCRIFGTADIDDYISYGGFTKRIVYDYMTACRYIDDAVSGNISRSMEKLSGFSKSAEFEKVTFEELRTVIEKMVQKYSGINSASNKLTKNNRDFNPYQETESFNRLRESNPNAIQEFVKSINADAQIVHKFTEDMIISIENGLIRLGFISATDRRDFFCDENFKWRSSSMKKECCIIQPAVKYYHLKKAMEFGGYEPDAKIKEDMTNQIVVYEASRTLSADKYSVCKVTFNNSENGAYDMLIYDKRNDLYYAFEIYNTAERDSEQCRHLLNESFRSVIDRKYGKRESACVLYSGQPFTAPQGISYLNILDFIKEIARVKDVKEAINGAKSG